MGGKDLRYILFVGFSLVDRAENSSKSPLFVGEMGANGSLEGGLAGVGAHGSLMVAGGDGGLADEAGPRTAQGSLPQTPVQDKYKYVLSNGKTNSNLHKVCFSK